MRIETDKIYCGDSLQVLQTLPDNCLDCCVTSPPYYALRDYGTDGQIGREATPEEYVSRITAVFHEVKRVLTPEGTCWLNIADTYCGTGSKADHQDPKYPKGRNGQQVAVNHRAPGCKPKDLIGIPWLVALALRGDGWYLRSSIIWHKGNAMPESTRDRPTRCYEYVFLLIRLRQMVRIIFYINTEGDIVLLHGFVKRHERATEQALETARARKLALASGTADITKLDFISGGDFDAKTL